MRRCVHLAKKPGFFSNNPPAWGSASKPAASGSASKPVFGYKRDFGNAGAFVKAGELGAEVAKDKQKKEDMKENKACAWKVRALLAEQHVTRTSNDVRNAEDRIKELETRMVIMNERMANVNMLIENAIQSLKRY